MAITQTRAPALARTAPLPKGLLVALVALVGLTAIGYLMDVARLWQPNTDLSEDELDHVKEDGR